MDEIKNELVIKANNLVEGFINMTHNEYRLTLYLISKIKKNDKHFRIQRISTKEFSGLIGCDKDIYGYMKNLSRSLLSKKISVLYKNGDRLHINWFSYTKYISNNGLLEVAFNKDLSPFLLNINQAYTKFFLNNVRKMKSKYSVRIYELLKQYEKIGKRKIFLEDLRMYLGIEPDEYKQYNDFKRRVVLTSQKEIKKYSDIYFDFKEIKESRKIVAIEFIIYKDTNKNIDMFDNKVELKKYPEKESLEEKNITEDKEIQKLISDFNYKYNGNLDYNLIKNLIKLKGIDCVKTCVIEFADFVDNANKVESAFYDFAKKYGTSGAYTKGNVYRNMIGNKPIQATNYEQREYDDEFFDKLYVNYEFVKDELKK